MNSLIVIIATLLSFQSKKYDFVSEKSHLNMNALSWSSIRDYFKRPSTPTPPVVEEPEEVDEADEEVVEEEPIQEEIEGSQYSLNLPKSQWTRDIIKDASGLKDENFNNHAIHQPNKKTGKTYNLADYGANLRDNSTDDRPIIEEVIAMAQAGDEVFFPNGVYNLNSTSSKSSSYNLALKSGVNLRGESQDGVILKTKYDDGGSGSFSIIQGYDVNNIHVKSMTLTSTWNKKYSSNPSSNNKDRGGPTYAIMIKGAKNKSDSHKIYLEKITVEKFRRVGISVANGSRDIVIDECLAKNATDVGGGGAGYGFVFQGNGHSNPVNDNQNPYYKEKGNDNYFNVLKNSKAIGPYIRHGIIIQYYSHNNLIEGNEFYDTAYGAIDLHGEDEYGIEVRNNKCNRIGYTSGKKAGCIELGNTGSKHDASGPLNYIHSNDVQDSGYGVRVEFSSSYTLIENNQFRDNKSFSDTAGVLLGKAEHIIVSNNKFTNNKAKNYSGIRLIKNAKENSSSAGALKNSVIEDNTFSSNNGPNIKIDDEDGGNIIEN